MAEKIEGWASLNEFKDGHPRFQREAFRGQDEPYRPSVLIISDTDQPPVVFTESEVKAMFREAIAKRYDYRESTDIVEAYDIELIASKYGIDLDLDGNLEPKTP